jgi:hypothetical protein
MCWRRTGDGSDGNLTAYVVDTDRARHRHVDELRALVAGRARHVGHEGRLATT